MSDTSGFWTRGKLVAGAIAAMIGAAGYFLGIARGAIAIIDAPTRLEEHEAHALERMEAFEKALESSRLTICELLGMFPSECPEFTLDHEGDAP